MNDPIIPPPPTGISTPAVVATPDPDAAKVQGLAPQSDGMIDTLCLADACVNGVKYAKDEVYRLDPVFAAQFSFFKVAG